MPRPSRRSKAAKGRQRTEDNIRFVFRSEWLASRDVSSCNLDLSLRPNDVP